MKAINGKLYCAAAVLLLLAGGAPLAAAGKKSQGKFSPLADSMRPLRKTPAQAAHAAFARFSAKQGTDWKIRYSPRTALPEAITGGRTKRYAGTPEQAVAAFFSENAELLKIDPAVLQLTLKKENLGVTHLQYQQYYRGIPVEFAYARAHVAAAGEIAGYQAKFEPGINLDIVPAVSAEQAQLTAITDLGRPMRLSKTELVIYPDEQAGALKLAWKVRGRSAGIWVYYIDAQAGTILLKYDDTRRFCALVTAGSSSGSVYDISPIPTGASDHLDLPEWGNPVTRPLSDQYFWINGNGTSTTTSLSGDYCSSVHGKVFSSLKGPYFAVSNFHGASAHYDNGGGEWRTYNHPTWTRSPKPYAGATDYPETVQVIPSPALLSSEVLAKVMPRFETFQVGSMDDALSEVDDGDEVHVKSAGLTGNNIVGSYIGTRTKAFLGPAAESDTYTITVKFHEAGSTEGYEINRSSFIVLTNQPNVSATASAIIWSTTTFSASTPNAYLDSSLGPLAGLDEVNVFYHLNKMRRYFQAMNLNSANPAGQTPADLSGRVPVMVHASGKADEVSGGANGLMNAFYDFEHNNIFFGDGPRTNGNYRSFALDGTIVRHEYGHLAVSRIYPIINFGEFGAISEALSDYFSLASLWKEGYEENNTAKKNLDSLGNFLGDGWARAISDTDFREMPKDWQGELYEDSKILSQSLYALRAGDNNASANNMGYITGGSVFTGLPMSDFLVWAALFYFPDSFSNFRDAMLDACRQLNAVPLNGNCVANKIVNSFSDHHIPGPAGDGHEISPDTLLCTDNNGPECATDISTMSWLSATIYPAGDSDFYSLPIGAGSFQASLSLPKIENQDEYKAYALYLFDSSRKYLAEAIPEINSWNPVGRCPDGDYTTPPTAQDCLTYNAGVTLTYTVPAAGRYYLLVTGGPNLSGNNSGVNSPSTYTLTTSYSPQGGATAYVDSGSLPDNDKISFTVPYNRLPSYSAPVSTTLAAMGYIGQAEQVFSYAQLRDHNNVKLDLARTNLTLLQGSHLQRTADVIEYTHDARQHPIIRGSVQIQPGFAAHYPSVGTVALEIFGLNHMGDIVSLGVSNPFNLHTAGTDIKTYNNVLRAPGDKVKVKYDLLSPGTLTLKVYTQTGALVKTIYDGPAEGKGTFNWDGTNSSGGKVASGIYFLKAKGPGMDKTEKIAIVR